MTVEGTILREVHDIAEKVAGIEQNVAHVKELAEATNGKVRALERWRAELRGAWRAVGVLPLLISLIAAVAGIGSFVVVIVYH